jgi:hypothetical protein
VGACGGGGAHVRENMFLVVCVLMLGKNGRRSGMGCAGAAQAVGGVASGCMYECTCI